MNEVSNFSRKIYKKRAKCSVFMQAVMYGFLSITVLAGCGESHVFHVPNNYQGSLVIFYNHPAGESKQYVNGKRLYVLPASGFMLSQFEKGSRWADWEVHYIDSSGNPLEELPNVPTIDKRSRGQMDSNQVYVYGIGYGHIIGGPTRLGLEHVSGFEGRDTVSYLEVVLSTPKDRDSIVNESKKHKDTLLSVKKSY